MMPKVWDHLPSGKVVLVVHISIRSGSYHGPFFQSPASRHHNWASYAFMKPRHPPRGDPLGSQRIPRLADLIGWRPRQLRAVSGQGHH